MMTRRTALGLMAAPALPLALTRRPSAAIRAAVAEYRRARLAYMRASADGFHDRPPSLDSDPADPDRAFYRAEHALAAALTAEAPAPAIDPDEPAFHAAVAAAVVDGDLIIAYGEVAAGGAIPDVGVMVVPLATIGGMP